MQDPETSAKGKKSGAHFQLPGISVHSLGKGSDFFQQAVDSVGLGEDAQSEMSLSPCHFCALGKGP